MLYIFVVSYLCFFSSMLVFELIQIDTCTVVLSIYAVANLSLLQDASESQSVKVTKAQAPDSDN